MPACYLPQTFFSFRKLDPTLPAVSEEGDKSDED